MVDKVYYSEIIDKETQGDAAAALINDNKRAVNEIIDELDGFGTAATRDTGSAANNIPLNSDLGTAATKDTGTAPGQIPTSDDLGSAAYVDVGTGDSEVPLNSDLGSLSVESGRMQGFNVNSSSIIKRVAPGGNVRDVYVTNDGSRVYVLDQGATVSEYLMSTPHDISTIGSVNSSFDASSFFTSSVSGFSISSDGLKLYMASAGESLVKEFDLPTAFSVDGATDSGNSFSVGARGVEISSDGSYVFFAVGDTIERYTLSPGYDLSTASLSISLDIGATAYGVRLSEDGYYMGVIGADRDVFGNPEWVYIYQLKTPFLFTANFYIETSSKMLTTVDTPNSSEGLSFSSDGKVFYIADNSEDEIFEYNSAVVSLV